MKAELQARNLEPKGGAEKLAAKLDGKTIIVLRQATEAGQLYGSVSTRDIAGLLNADGAEVNRVAGRAQRADQDDRPVQGAAGAASGSRDHRHRHRRAQRRRSRAHRARRGRDRAPRTRPRRKRQPRLAAAEAFFEPEAAKALREDDEPEAEAEAAPADEENKPAKAAKKKKKDDAKKRKPRARTHKRRAEYCLRCAVQCPLWAVVSIDRRNTLSLREKMECGDGSEVSSRVHCGREDGVVGSLAAGRVAQSDWASVW